MVHSGKQSSYNKNHQSYEEWLDNLDREISNRGTDSKWKALDKIDYKVIPDTSFTRDRTGAGSIEYFSADDPGIRYPNGYYVQHPMPGNDVILYNPNDNDEQDIRLDALHIMPKDATYDALNSLYRDRAMDSDVSYNAQQRYAEDVQRYGQDNVDSYEQYFNNEADGLLRNMFIEGTPEYIEGRHYYPDKQQLREWNKDLLPYIDRIQDYLETGERPKNVLPEVTIIGKNKGFAEGGPKNANREYKSANSWSTVNVGKTLAPILEPISRTIMDSGETWALFSKDKKFTITNDDTSTAKSTYLMPRSAQRAVFLDRGYEPRPKDYGLVKKAVGNRNVPVYQRRPDDASREDVVPIGNLEAWGSLDDQYDGWYGKHEAVLEVPATYPTAFYISTDGKKIYQKGWDLNDYGDSANDWYDSNLKKNAAKALDLIGSPTVVTTGISEVGNFSDFYNREPGLIEEMLQSKGLKPLQIGYDKNKVKDNPYYSGEYIPALPDVTIKGKRKNKKEDGGDITYVDTVRMDSNGNISDDKGNIIGNSVILPEFEVTGVNPKNQFVQPNDNLWVDNGRAKNPELFERGLAGAKSHAEWEKEHPALAKWSYATAAAPFAVASAPLVTVAGDALAATSLGNAITSGLGTMGSYITAPTLLGAPAYAWGDAALSSAFAVHGINDMSENGVTPENLLEVAPLGQLVPNLGIELANAKKSIGKGVNTVRKQLNAEDRIRNLEYLERARKDNFNGYYVYGVANEDQIKKYPFASKYLEEIHKLQKERDRIEGVINRNFDIIRRRQIPDSHLSKTDKGNMKTLEKQGYIGQNDAANTIVGDEVINKLIPLGKDNLLRYINKNSEIRPLNKLGINSENITLDSNRLLFNKRSANPFNPKDAVTTGNIKIVDASTGKSKMYKLDSSQISGTRSYTYAYPSTTPIKETEASAIYPQAPKEYIDAVQKNIDYVTNEAIPGSKVFGSSANVAKGNLYHDASDIDLLMPESMALKHPEFKNWSMESPDTYAYYHPTAGKLDVNILKSNGEGKAIGARAHELYAQLYPKEYRELMDSYIAEGKVPSVDLPLNKSAEELFESYDPVVKSIADAFGSGKDKHMRRAVYLLHYGKTEDVKKGFKMYANYVLGGEYKPSNVPLSAFKDPAKNSEIIDALGLKAVNKEQFVNDPERMKLLYEYQYFHEGFLGRGVDIYNAKNTYPSLTQWLPEGKGGTGMGVGLNAVLGGDSGYGNIYGTLIPEKLGIEFTTKDPVELLKTKRALLGRRPLSEAEINRIDEIAKNHGIDDVKDVSSFAEMLNHTAGKQGQKYKDFLKDIEEEFGIPAIQGKYDFQGSPYVSLTEDILGKDVKQIIPRGLDRPTNSVVRDRAASNKEDRDNIESIFNYIRNTPFRRQSRLLTDKWDIGSHANLHDMLYKRKSNIVGNFRNMEEELRNKAFSQATSAEERLRKLKNKKYAIEERKEKIKFGGKLMSVGAGGALLYYLYSKLKESDKALHERFVNYSENKNKQE